jgi:nucleoside-diphosphate-sugar epimerase
MAANAITENTNAPLSVFITGATGALGREVTRQLKAAGHRVTGATTGYENAAVVRADGGIPAYPDLMRAGEIRSILLAAKADVVLNLAPQLANHLPQQRANWDTALMDEGVSALIEACQSAGVKFLVHTSYAYADEDSEALNTMLEAVKAGEQKVLSAAVPGCVLRMGFVYGAESTELIATRDTLMMGRMIDGGPSNSHALWINAPDAARAVILAALQRPAGALLTVVEDQAASPADFMSYFADSQGVSRPGRAPRFAAWAQPSPDQVALMSLNPHASGAEAKSTLGWSPRFANYHQGIDDVLLAWRTSADVEAR